MEAEREKKAKRGEREPELPHRIQGIGERLALAPTCFSHPQDGVLVLWHEKAASTGEMVAGSTQLLKVLAP